MRRLVTLICVLLFATMAFAGPGGEPMRGPMARRGMGGPMEHSLFPPELILMNQLALGLSNDQVASVKQSVSNTQTQVLDAQVQLHRVTEQLHAALENTTVELVPALGLASQAMELEKQIKMAHLTLMIRVKNLLTADQQEKARALAPHHAEGPTPPAED